MLDVKRNRLDYGRLLIPPEGFVLRRAVATCYSVDLDTLLSIPVALYYAQTLEGQLQGKDVQLIRAIQSTARLITVYHQEGQVRVPHAAKDIYAYFEEALVPILPSDAFTSFHPKTWVLRYERQEDPADVMFRVIVLSRNLTFDRRWDVASFLEGRPSGQATTKVEPLVAFVRWLHEWYAFPGGSKFLTELSQVRFERPEEFQDFKFHPIGIPGYQANPIENRKAARLLCLSPFVHPMALTTLTHNVSEPPLLLCRRIELKRVPQAVLSRLEAYYLSDVVVDGERLFSAEEGDGEALDQDLHAKAFLFDKDDVTTWFLGSANATKAAFERNIEFMLELKGTSAATRLNRVRKQLLGNDEVGGLFVAFEPEEGGLDAEEEKRREAAIRKLEYAILTARIHGTVKPSANEVNFDLTIALDFRAVSAATSFSVAVRPFILGVDEREVSLETDIVLTFSNINETSLSRFLHVTIREEEESLRAFLLRIPVEGIPTTRLDNIFKSIINSRDKFFSYLRFLLTDDLSKGDFNNPPPKSGGGSGSGGEWGLDIPLFEQLLVTASRNPGRLLEVDRVIASLREPDNERVIPNDFLSLWEVFKAAMPHAEPTDE